MVVNTKGRIKMNINSISTNNQQNFGKLYIDVKDLRKGHVLFSQRRNQIEAIREAIPELKELARDCDLFIKSGIFSDNSYRVLYESSINFKAIKSGDFFARFRKALQGRESILWDTDKNEVILKAQKAIAELEDKTGSVKEKRQSIHYRG